MSLGTKMLYEFGVFRLDPAEHQLLAGDNALALTPKAFELLVYMVRNSGRLLTKEELLKNVCARQLRGRSEPERACKFPAPRFGGC
jgi:DNA-binding response OmpR family regulator